MKYIRYFLYVAFLTVLLILWNNWISEYQDVVKQQSPVVNPQQMGDSSANSSKSKDSVNAVLNTENSIQASDQLKNTVLKQNLIHINTDVLNVAIDLNGGNILSVSLPKYNQTLKDKTPYVLLNDNPETFYIAQNFLASQGEFDFKPQNLAFSSDFNTYTLSQDQNTLKVVLKAKTQDGLLITKTFVFNRDSYDINMGFDIKNTSLNKWIGNYYLQLDRRVEMAGHSLFSLPRFFGVAISTPEKNYTKLAFSKLEKTPLGESVKGGWLCMTQNYFLGAFVPDKDTQYYYYSKAEDNGLNIVGMQSPAILLNPGQSIDFKNQFYAGPKIASLLDKAAPHLSRTIDFGMLWIISAAIFWLMKFIYNFIGNWGWSIVLVTLLIKLLFYKLSETSYKSMAAMRTLQPKMKNLKERFKDDKQGLQKAMMELYKREKINPLGGCLPIVIQIPVFFALYWVLIYSVELRQAPFIFWIHDLSAKDPYYVLPVLMGLSMFIQQKLTPASPDPAQAKMMMFLPVIMTFFFLNFPSGLVLYWLVNNVVSVLQQWYIIRKFEHGGYKHHDKDKRKRKSIFELFSQNR